MKQNKYQEALDYINKCLVGKHGKDCVGILQELIGKETPVKPVKKQYKYSHHSHCGKCDERFCVVRYDDIKNDIVYKHKLSYKKCPECFQKVDWSDEE